MKMMIKYQVKNIPTKVSYHQEEGQNYLYWRRSKEEFGYKPDPQDYEMTIKKGIPYCHRQV